MDNQGMIIIVTERTPEVLRPHPLTTSSSVTESCDTMGHLKFVFILRTGRWVSGGW